MSMLYVWDPAIGDAPTILDVIVTRGDSDQVGSGSTNFIAGITRALGISSSPERCLIKPYRCNFYSEYWQEGGWTKSWDFVWRLSIHFNRTIAPKKLPRNYVGIDEIDDYSPTIRSYRQPPFNCLAIGEFNTDKHAQAAARKITADKQIQEARREARAPAPSIDILRVAAKQFHLRADIGQGDEKFFESGYPGMIVSMLETDGGNTHTKS